MLEEHDELFIFCQHRASEFRGGLAGGQPNGGDKPGSGGEHRRGLRL